MSNIDGKLEGCLRINYLSILLHVAKRNLNPLRLNGKKRRMRKFKDMMAIMDTSTKNEFGKPKHFPGK